MKFIPIIGLIFALWGLFTLDLVRFSVGSVLFLGSFFIDQIKNEDPAKEFTEFINQQQKFVEDNDEILDGSGDKSVSQLEDVLLRIIAGIKSSLEASDIDMSSEKAKLVQGLYLLGMIDAATQQAKMNYDDFLEIFFDVFGFLNTEYRGEFDDEFRSILIRWYEKMGEKHPALPAISKGGEIFIEFAKGNFMAPIIRSSGDIKELIEDNSIPESIYSL